MLLEYFPHTVALALFLSAVMTTFIPVIIQKVSIKDNSLKSQ